MTPIFQEAAISVLLTSDPAGKAFRARAVAALWRAGKLRFAPDWDGSVPERPARPRAPVLVPPAQVPRRRLSTAAGRAALLHAVAHIEFNAIDLAVDMAVRFARSSELDASARSAFITDWLTVGDDEARHFMMVTDRLGELGTAYGDLEAHDGLWEAAMATSDDIAARLAVAPLVLEARGLDVTPAMINRLNSAGDDASAGVLEIIYHEEIGHVSCGRRWLDHVCERRSENPRETFHRLVRERFPGGLKLPVNALARAAAGLEPDFYEALLP
ncbi:MAG: hypothetical protein HLUCCA04_03285 [Oceanicaulis sp. HLUCCA04]|nr:MAG: hypothetical protein HLUCCA04_03285 [Oceanicaulis sp. HLUCCA04]